MISHLYTIYHTALRSTCFALLALGCSHVATAATLTATYTATFDSTWSAATHPDDFPRGAHFSPLIGGTHHDGIHFWLPGELATPGIQSVAETGNPNTFRNEINDAIANGTARDVISGSGLDSPGSASITFDIHQSHPLVTLVTMIAPSPDWFIGVHDKALLQDGRWADEIVVGIFPYDAGTDSGATYRSPNQPTIPPEPIALLQEPPVLVDGQVPAMGTLTFRRVAVICQVMLNQPSYTEGDTIATETLRLVSQLDEGTTVEVGIWLQAPETPPVSIVDAVETLQPGDELNFASVSLGEITADAPRGTYILGCRVIDPVTKELRYELLQTVEVQ